MALDTNAISAVLNRRFDDALSSQINRSVILPQLVPVRRASSQVLQWVAKFGTAAPTTAVIADGANVTVFNSDTKKPALLTFGTYHDAFGITGKAMASAAASGNPAELVNLFREEIEESIPRLASAMAVDFYKGTGVGENMTGLTATAGAIRGTGVYANIDRAAFPQWAGNEDAFGGVQRPLSIQLMRKMRRLIYTASGMKPDFILCDPTMHESYGELMGDKRQYHEDVTIRGRTVTLDGGYGALMFDKIPVIEDINAPPSSMLFLNSRTIDIQQLPSPADTVNRAQGEVGLKGTEEEQFGESNTSLTARVQPLAVNGDLFNFGLFAYPQIRSRRPNANGYLTDLLPA